MKILIKNKEVLIDEEDFERVSLYKWSVGWHNQISSKQGSHTLQLSRFILQVTDGKLYVDHINRDRLDNRKCNLRVCTNQQNSFNNPKRWRTNMATSKYKGVYLNKLRKKFVGAITYNSRSYIIYYSTSEAFCAYAYNVAATFLMKEFAYLNNVELNEQDKRSIEFYVKMKLSHLKS